MNQLLSTKATITCHTLEGEWPIFYRVWQPRQGEPRAVVHINHGMAEHSDRYSALALELAQQGLVVFAQDHPGHGQSVPSNTELGTLPVNSGWESVLTSMTLVNRQIQSRYPQLPQILFGHSMGSFACLDFLERKLAPDSLSAVILSGSNQNPAPLDYALRVLARGEITRQGARGVSPIIRGLTFDAFNRQFKPNRTSVDWLSSDASQVDRYLYDPLCGFGVSNQLWHAFAASLTRIFRPSKLKRLPKAPAYLLAFGEQDPLSCQGGAKRLANSLSRLGLNVDSKIFVGRHEILNEVNHDQVSAFISQWIDTQLRLVDAKLISALA